MWIIGNLFSKDLVILRTIDDKKEEKPVKDRDESKKDKPKMESIEHLRKWCGLD